MTMADYGEFNNNNYLPGLYSDMDAALNYQTAMAHNRSPAIGQNSFTFTSPTQCITLATYRPCIQTTSPISSLSAPGVGTSWQHSIPVTMPWVDMNSHLAQPGTGTTTVFTGTPTSPHLEGQQSFSAPLRRPKRKALQLPDEAPTSKVYLCADQFANLKISPCEKQIYGLPTDDGGNTGVQFYTGGNTVKSRSDSEGWQRFRDVENRLDVEVDDDVDLSMGIISDKEGPYLKVAKGVLDPCVASTSILPRRVMEDITKPCMQIVLWKSPGEMIRDIAAEKSKPLDSTSSTVTPITATIKSTDTSKMDTSERSPLTSRDNIMDTSLETPVLDSLSNSHFQPLPSSGYGRFSAIDLLTPPSLSNLVQLPSSSFDSDNNAAISCSSNEQVDLDMFDSLDDYMQL